MLAAVEHPGPVVFLEHKLLSEQWLDYLGGTSRESVRFDVPVAGARGDVADVPDPVPLGGALSAATSPTAPTSRWSRSG